MPKLLASLHQFIAWLLAMPQAWLRMAFRSRQPKAKYSFRYCGRRKCPPPAHPFPTRKPASVRREVIHLKALLPDNGCRALAEVFNRRFAHRSMRVGKTFVNEVLRSHQYEILCVRRRLRTRPPTAVPRNAIWAMDMTGKSDETGLQHVLLGVLEHQSRRCLTLTALKDKTSITLLRHLLDAIECHGKPRCLRTDNEAVFTSRLFRFGLQWLRITHQRSDPGCPWQNGRIERFFGTLKGKLDHWSVNSVGQLNRTLSQFQFWYNHVRLHQNLDGRTPIECWNGIETNRTVRKTDWFEAWDGSLRGFHFRL